MKAILLTMFMGFSFFGLCGQEAKFKTVDATEFAKFIENPEVVVLDVRTSEEHVEGFIPGTHYNIDVLKDNYEHVATETLQKDKPVALYCRSGNRSKNAARILAEQGYEVVELGTGFRGWVAVGYQIAKPEL
jgi:rhodanese-related sulfurtransferase